MPPPSPSPPNRKNVDMKRTIVCRNAQCRHFILQSWTADLSKSGSKPWGFSWQPPSFTAGYENRADERWKPCPYFPVSCLMETMQWRTRGWKWIETSAGLSKAEVLEWSRGLAKWLTPTSLERLWFYTTDCQKYYIKGGGGSVVAGVLYMRASFMNNQLLCMTWEKMSMLSQHMGRGSLWKVVTMNRNMYCDDYRCST